MSELKFIRFDSSTCTFPKPVFGLLPRLEASRLKQAKKDGCWSVIFDKHKVKHFVRGRYALGEAYWQATGGDGTVFLPSYHCRTMVDPAINLGLRVVLYPLNEDLTPDISTLSELLRAAKLVAGTNSSLLVVPHYFGFIQVLADLRALCVLHGVQILEDCSHALIKKRTQVGPGSEGDFVIASPYKFIGSEDGGVLVEPLTSNQVSVPMERAGWRRECVAWARFYWHRLRQSQKVPAVNFEHLVSEVSSLSMYPLNKGADIVETVVTPSLQFINAEAKTMSLGASRWLMAQSDIDCLANERRRNYMRWLDCVEQLSGCRPLFPVLPKDCVPYMFPLVLDDPDKHFFLLKYLGVPVGRWDEVAVSHCPVAGRYRLSLIHLPCYQGLDSDAMAWLTAAVSAVFQCGGEKSA